MSLTESQRSTLAAHIASNTDPDVVQALSIRNDTFITGFYNQPSSFIVWKEAITPEEYREEIVWTEVDGLQTGKARIWEWITQNMTMNIDATKANVRQGIADVFPANQNTRGKLLAIAKEPATVAEAVFATGTGTDNNPGTRTFKGTLTTEDVGRALNEAQ